MNLLLIAPLAPTAVGIAAAWLLPRATPPALWVRVLTVSMVASATAAGAALLLVAAAGASEVRVVSDLIGWCEALTPGQHGAAPWIGLLAAAASCTAAGSGLGRWRRLRAQRGMFPAVDGVRVVHVGGPVAFAVPGHRGGIVLGADVLSALEPDERRAVLAHERAHLDLHHHRFVDTADVCAAALPLLRPLARRVRFGTERWADEAAAHHVGSRRTVARAVARVSLLGHVDAAPSTALGFAGSGALARIDALAHPAPTHRRCGAGLAATIVLLVSLIGSSVQIHHLGEFLSHVCPG